MDDLSAAAVRGKDPHRTGIGDVILSPAWLRTRLLGISPEETTFARRGFRGDERAVVHLEQSGGAFVRGYNAALEFAEPHSLAGQLSKETPDLRGFAFEGAAMALGLLDRLTPWRRNRWLTFVEGPAAAHVYMAHVGLGWALARLRRRVEPTLAGLDPVLRWLVVDGYGFHEGYFHWPRAVEARAVPQDLTGYACRAFDQGLGRSLWFVRAADVARVAQTIDTFPPARRADLWSGVGLASAYAGGAAEEALRALAEAAGDHFPALAQGTAFAAKARLWAGNLGALTELACRALGGLSAGEAAALTDECLKDLPGDGAEPAFEVWRRRIQARWAPVTERTAS